MQPWALMHDIVNVRHGSWKGALVPLFATERGAACLSVDVGSSHPAAHIETRHRLHSISGLGTVTRRPHCTVPVCSDGKID